MSTPLLDAALSCQFNGEWAVSEKQAASRKEEQDNDRERVPIRDAVGSDAYWPEHLAGLEITQR